MPDLVHAAVEHSLQDISTAFYCLFMQRHCQLLIFVFIFKENFFFFQVLTVCAHMYELLTNHSFCLLNGWLHFYSSNFARYSLIYAKTCMWECATLKLTYCSSSSSLWWARYSKNDDWGKLCSPDHFMAHPCSNVTKLFSTFQVEFQPGMNVNVGKCWAHHLFIYLFFTTTS